ncbi:MAG: D-alanyl-D-alanine carboxypeptidase [Chroococcidiopsidaceae cyanobacterium CP_BM_ER_R8_30]|nr:D-alanyl-D-alanine carboxypeptidase [Chroococcidiopsidaceae cyanobacterium CP_BM_ER_R8_30]
MSPLATSSQLESHNTPVNSTTLITEPVYKVVPVGSADPVTNAEIQEYINRLADKGFAKSNQGVWIQSNQTLLANYQGTIPLKAASITKVATTLVALQTWGPKHQCVTLIGRTGPIQSGVLQGDLVIQGAEDPFFIWEDAINLGNTLNQIGIERVKGNLVVVGKFYMDYDSNPERAGNLLKEGLNAQIWSAAAQTQYLTLPKNAPQPQVAIEGSVQVVPSAPGELLPLVRHFSLPLAQILKQMNLYSNNQMAVMLADSAGGANVVAQKAALAASVPTAEIQLENGAGAAANRISPRAACAMFLAIEGYLQPYHMTIANVFAISGQDVGILQDRPLPPLSVVKTGTLEDVSAVAGAMPTQAQGSVWFAIMNIGEDVDEFSQDQDLLLQRLLNQWGRKSPAELTFIPRQGFAKDSSVKFHDQGQNRLTAYNEIVN